MTSEVPVGLLYTQRKALSIPQMINPLDAPSALTSDIEDINTAMLGITAIRSWSRGTLLQTYELGSAKPDMVFPNTGNEIPQLGHLLKLIGCLGRLYRARNKMAGEAINESTGEWIIDKLQSFEDLFKVVADPIPEADLRDDPTSLLRKQVLESITGGAKRYGTDKFSVEPIAAPLSETVRHGTFNKLTGIAHDLGSDLGLLRLLARPESQGGSPEQILRRIELLSIRGGDVMRGQEKPLSLHASNIPTHIKRAFLPPANYPANVPFVTIGRTPPDVQPYHVDYSYGMFDSLYEDIADNIRREFIEGGGGDREWRIPFASVSFQTSEDGKYLLTIFRDKGRGFDPDILEHGFEYGKSIRTPQNKTGGVGLAFHRDLLREKDGDLLAENTYSVEDREKKHPLGAQLTVVQKLL